VSDLPTCWQAPTCRLRRFGHRERDSRGEPLRDRAFWRSRRPGRPARQLPLVCDHVRRRTTWGRLVASIPPRRLLRDHAGKRCGVARRGGRSRWRPSRWIWRRRPPRWRPSRWIRRWWSRRWEFSARPRVRGQPLRWTNIPSRARWPASLRLPVLVLSLLRLRPVRSRLPVRRVLRPVFTLLCPSILLLGRSVGLRPKRRPMTFAEKVERAVLDALRSVGFRWGGGSWVDERARLDRAVMSAVFGNSARAHDPTPAPGERGR